jgi:AcrR family transcriptional regulator
LINNKHVTPPPTAVPQPRRSALERREDILLAALAEFAARGYHATTTAAIAQRAGISQPYIYALFPDKKVLFLACHERAMQRLRQTLFTAARAPDGPSDTRATLARVEEAFRDLVGSDPTQLRFLLQSHAAASDPEIRDVVRQRFMAIVDEGVRATGAARSVVLEQLARGLFFSVALALDLPEAYRLPPAADSPHNTHSEAV